MEASISAAFALATRHSLRERVAMRVGLLLAVLLLAACRGPDSEAPPLGVDAASQAAHDAIVADSVSAGLTARDAAGRVVPGLAQSWRVSDDGRSIVFRLREARFADGRAVTAADAVSSLERARSGRAGATTRELMAGVTGVVAPLDNVVELQLSTAQPELIELLATPPLAIRPRGRSGTAGPFLAQQVKPAPGDPPRTNLSANPGYFAAETLTLEKASVRTSTPDEAIARFNRGETELVLGGGLDGLGTARVTVRRESLLLEQPRAALLLLVNHRHPALARAEVRRALQVAINREALGPALFGSQAAAPVPAIVPANVAGYAPPQPAWAREPLVARQELARGLLAVAAPGKPLRLTVAVTDSQAEARLLTVVAADLAQVGVELALARRTPADHRKAVQKGDFDLALVRRDTPVDSPVPFLVQLRCGQNPFGVCLPEADRLLAESWTAQTHAERMQKIAAAEKLWADDAAAIGLVQPLGWSLVAPRIAGFMPNPSGSHALRHLTLNADRRLLK
jgi:oligopeptide transport system substrate-binding protein